MFKDKLRKLIGRAPYLPPEEAAYRRLAQKGWQPASVIDVGAYQGEWTRLVRRVFPSAPVLMVEAQEQKRPYLDRVCSDLPDVQYVRAMLAATSGKEMAFFEMETGSSAFPERSNAPRRETVQSSRTLDEVAATLAGPIFLKIDVQGAELEVLAGGERILSRCELVQLEVALLPYNEGAPTLLEVVSQMDDRGWVPFDIAGFSRPNGRDLAQIDLLFVPRDSPLRQTYFTF